MVETNVLIVCVMDCLVEVTGGQMSLNRLISFERNLNYEDFQFFYKFK